MIFGAILMATGLITGAITVFTERVQVIRSPFQPHAYGYRSKAYNWRS